MLPGAHEQNLATIMTGVVGLPRSTVDTFEREAYGAVLTLVYFRAMPLAVRTDIHMRFMERGACGAASRQRTSPWKNSRDVTPSTAS